VRSRARLAAALLLVVLPLAGALPAEAGELAVEAQGGYFEMAATKSAEALFGSAGGATFGGAVRYTVWRGAFVSAGLRTFSKDGERVFIASPGSPVQKLGFPVALKLTPFLLTAGYRFRHGKAIVPYAHVGAAITSWSEESTVAGESLDADGSKTGFIGAAGVEYGRGLLRFGVELGYSSIGGALGTAGVSQVYGEDQIGGFHAVGKVGVAFGL